MTELVTKRQTTDDPMPENFPFEDGVPDGMKGMSLEKMIQAGELDQRTRKRFDDSRF